MPLDHRTPRTRGRRPALALAALTALAAGGGCQSLGSTNPLAVWRLGGDSSLSRAPTAKETGDDRNLMARWISPKKPPAGNFDASPLVLGSDGWKPMKAEANPEADKEYRAAEALFQQNKLAEAEPAFLALSKNRKGTPWGEKGQFYLAETQYQRGNLVAAHDSFELLMKDYAGTDYAPKLVEREYAIALAWLAECDPKTPAAKKMGFASRFNGGQPLLDTHGYALQALEHVRHHNPKGPLADDAVMRIADEHMAARDYESAALYYDQLITEHPKSEFLQRAQLAVIESHMSGYLGPEYDGTGLLKAREMVKQTLATFPDRPEGNEKLYRTLDIINDQEAERTFSVGDYYRQAHYPGSAEYYFAMIPQRWPKSPWAAKAKVQLAALSKAPRETHAPSKIMSQPGANDPFFTGSGSSGGMNGMGTMTGMGGMGGMGGGGMGMPGGAG